MKLFSITAFLVMLLVSACNNEEKTTATNTSDTTAVTHHSEATTPAAGTSVDTSSIAGQDMMSLMQQNMDEMKAMPSTGNPDNDYAGLMKIHHMGAIQMAQAELARGTDPQVKAMAQRMLDAQQQEVATLNTFLSGHNAHGGGDAFYKSVIAGMNNMKMDMDHSGSVDKQFIQMMIPHHQGAIDMSNAYLKAGAHEAQLKTMATKIIEDQKKEIAEMQAWLKSH